MQAEARAAFVAPRTAAAFRAFDGYMARALSEGHDYAQRDALLDELTQAIITEFHAWPREVTRRLVGHPQSREAIRNWVH